MIVHKEVDAVTIGVGWTGGILASELTRAGYTVVGLERGRVRGMEDWQNDHDELRFAVDHELHQNPALETWSFRHNPRETALPFRELGAFLPGTGLGGAGVHWNGQTYRFHPSDFRIRSYYEERYGKNFIPRGMTIADWGITYEELEPYYDRFEYMAGISGKAGNLRGKIVPGGNPFEGPRSREYPTPPQKMAETSMTIAEGASRLGLHPFPQPSANLSETYTNPDGITRNACTYCGFCERFGCEVGAKADATVTVLPLAYRTGKYELRPHSNVFEIVHDGRRARAVRYFDAKGQIHEQPAKIVLVTAFTFNNAKLLLLSKLGRPYDPVTGEGVVGKNFSHQITLNCAAFYDDKTFKRYMGSGANAMIVDDYGADFDHEKAGGFVGGGCMIAQNTGSRPIQQTFLADGVKTWGAEWKAFTARYFLSQAEMLVQCQSPAHRNNSLGLDPTYRDAYGLPLTRITFDFTENEQKMAAFMGERTREVLHASGASKMKIAKLEAHYDTTRYQTTHTMGGCIMGSDPHASVVNTYSQMWDADNVFVVGGSSFPQNGSFNPTGTINALAYRAADGIVNRYFKHPGPLV